MRGINKAQQFILNVSLSSYKVTDTQFVNATAIGEWLINSWLEATGISICEWALLVVK
jgi:hypothetical protein